MSVIVHEFRKSLELSQSYSDAPWWLEVYRQAFPSLRAAVNVRNDGWAQRGGIDRLLTLSSGRTIGIDEKVREKVWPDILLERWSDEAKRVPGWIQKPLACEYIAYAFVPSKTCHLFPTLTLQRAWRLNGKDWADTYGVRRSKNPGYFTASVPVPIKILEGAIADAMRIEWRAES